MKQAFDTKMLNYLIENAGFAPSGDPKAAAQFLDDVLMLCPFYETQGELDVMLPNYGMFYLVINFVDHTGALEHGGGIGGSWLTDEGYALRAKLAMIDWEMPAELAVATVEPRVAIGSAYNEDANTYDTVLGQLNFCACGMPDEMLAFLFKILGAAKNADTAALAQLLPNAGMRQFVVYQLMHLGVLTVDFMLTEHGASIFEKMQLLESVGFEDENEF